MERKGKKVVKLQGNLNAVTQGAYIQLQNDLSNDPSTAQRILIDRIRFKAARLGFMEMAIMEGNDRVEDRYIIWSNNLRNDLAILLTCSSSPPLKCRG